MGQRITQVDAFADAPFSGNPAAVRVLEEPADERWMQRVAREMNLSQTAFLHAVEDGFSLRWFTPSVEIDLCGHATLASAHVLWEEGHLARDETARFHTRSGLLTATRADPWIELRFPEAPAAAAEAPTAVAAVARVRDDYIVEVDADATVRALAPDLTALERAPARAAIVTSRSASSDYDFIVRVFASRQSAAPGPGGWAGHHRRAGGHRPPRRVTGLTPGIGQRVSPCGRGRIALQMRVVGHVVRRGRAHPT